MPKNYVYSDLSAKDSLVLEIAGVQYAVAQFSAAWAANEVPTAVAMLAIGRDARTQTPAQIHLTGANLQQMAKAAVWFEPVGEFDRNANWPEARQKIFDGFFTGFAYRKVAGKIHVVCNLIHWIAALGFSSSLTKNGHVSNPTDLNAAAVLESLAGTGAGKGNNISSLVAAGISADNVRTDLWVAIKDVFCKMAKIPTMPCGGPQQECGGAGVFSKNDTALDALSRIEGPAPDCPVPYTHGVALKMQTDGISTVEGAVATAIGDAFVESYAAVSFWDKLVAEFCPLFGMAVVPMVESAIVVADCPAYRGGVWKTITPEDYDSYDLTRELHRPLRAVGVVAGYVSQTQAGVNRGAADVSVIGGCYAENSVSAGDGMVMYVAAPAWLECLNTQPNYAAKTTGLGAERPAANAVAPNAARNVRPDALGLNANKLYERYAHEVFLNQMLRGQAGSFSGKLRFDIAPLSILRLIATGERFIGPGQDTLAVTLYGCVQRVTISINAEAGLAGTTFSLSHVRTEAENTVDRTSTAEHPLFGKAIHGHGKHGSPLLNIYENLFAGDGPAPPPVVT